MDDSNYEYEGQSDGSGNSDSFERRLKLKNTATGIALLSAKMQQGQQNPESNEGQQNSGRSGKNRRSK